MPADRSPPLRPRARHNAWALIVLLLVTLATRAPMFGNPVIQIDEQFYLFVADRMLHGAIPFVDIWDRKPIGLFLIYAGARLLGGDGVVQYQLLAALCAFATAWLVNAMAQKLTDSAFAAVAAGVIYLLWLPIFGGVGGQSQVFYNLLVTAAALVVLNATAAADRGAVRRGGLCAMVLMGLAIQVKYTVVFEGAFFGLALSYGLWKAGEPLPRLLLAMTGWVAVALLPTLAAAAAYWWLGHFDAFFYANFLSIFDRVELPTEWLLENLVKIVQYLFPLVVAAAFAIHRPRTQCDSAEEHARRFAHGWLMAAALGFFVFGTFYDHYALPMVAPLAICAAPLFSTRRGQIVAGVIILFGAHFGHHNVAKDLRRRGTAEQYSVLAAAAKPYAASRGLAVLNAGYPLLYMTTQAKLPTRFTFPNHLTADIERPALGVDAQAELGHLFDRKPGAIVLFLHAPDRESLVARGLIMERLRQDYTLLDCYPLGRRSRALFVHNDFHVTSRRPDGWKAIPGSSEFYIEEVCGEPPLKKKVKKPFLRWPF